MTPYSYPIDTGIGHGKTVVGTHSKLIQLMRRRLTSYLYNEALTIGVVVAGVSITYAIVVLGFVAATAVIGILAGKLVKKSSKR
jgi:hypothetical protein